MIRRAGIDDAADVARLLDAFNTEFGDDTPGVEALTERTRTLLDADDTAILLAGDPPVGVAVLRFRGSIWDPGDEAYLAELYVAPQRRREGLGRSLLDAVTDLARKRGVRTIDLNTSEDDTAALALYERAGFTNREGRPDGPRMLYFERDL